MKSTRLPNDAVELSTWLREFSKKHSKDVLQICELLHPNVGYQAVRRWLLPEKFSLPVRRQHRDVLKRLRHKMDRQNARR